VTSEEPEPYTTVEMQFGNSDYQNICSEYGGGDKLFPQWRALGNLLAHRPGWYCEMSLGDVLWSLGPYGSSRLNTHIEPDGTFYGYEHDTDDSFVTTDIAALEQWLIPREKRARQISPLMHSFMSDDSWRLFKTYEFEARVSWSDGWYMAEVKGLPEEACFEKSLPDVVRSVREVIVRSAGGPAELAADLCVRVRLNQRATHELAK
jgi:hypothetical protein